MTAHWIGAAPRSSGRSEPWTFTQPSGVEVVTANCLSCHAAKLSGQVVVGLGTTAQDFTQDPSQQIELA